MNSLKVGIMGDSYEVFSLAEAVQPCEIAKYKTKSEKRRIYLYPPLDENISSVDFLISAPCLLGGCENEYCCAALAASGFLTLKRGLPLDTMSFNINEKTYNVFNTGEGYLKISAPKSKRKFVSTVAFVCGADVECLISSDCPSLRAFKTDAVENVTDGAFKALLAIGDLIPSAALAYSQGQGTLKLKTYTEHMKNSPSRLSLLIEALRLIENSNPSFEVSVDGYKANIVRCGSAFEIVLKPQC